MAHHLDLEEQEQLDQLKHFWKQYGNAITWVLIAALSVAAAWNGYQYWQRSQAAQAAALFDEMDKVVRAADLEKAQRVYSDMQSRYAKTQYAQQAGLIIAKMAYDAGKPEVAKSILIALAENAADVGYAQVARLRLASLLMEAKDYDAALKALDGAESSDAFAALVADRKGDIYMLQGKREQAKEAYQKAFKGMDERSEYRRLVEVKLNALGVNPEARPS